MTGWRWGEPTLADVQAEFPHWNCSRGNSGLYYAEHKDTSQWVNGEDPLDLRDQIKAAEARHSYDSLLPGRWCGSAVRAAAAGLLAAPGGAVPQR